MSRTSKALARKMESSSVKNALTSSISMRDYKSSVVIDGINLGNFQTVNSFLGNHKEVISTCRALLLKKTWKRLGYD